MKKIKGELQTICQKIESSSSAVPEDFETLLSSMAGESDLIYSFILFDLVLVLFHLISSHFILFDLVLILFDLVLSGFDLISSYFISLYLV